MTRINLIPPRELHTKHLVAEYRELPRVVKLAVNYWIRNYRGKKVAAIPEYYTLGTGHVTFFYNKYLWLQQRYNALVMEMFIRNFTVSHPFITTIGSVVNAMPDLTNEERLYVHDKLFSKTNWVPGIEEIELNKARIKERLPL